MGDCDRLIAETVLKHRGSSVLVRDDFDSGPVSLDLIEENLWLGNLKAACDLPTLQKYKITHILTVDSVPLPRVVETFTDVVNKYIHIADIPKEDIITHFPEAIAFIRAGQENGKVLVHCYFGMSRSAAMVIAFMMAKHKLTYDEAFYIVKAKRSITCPNSGFVAQLKLFREMECVLDQDYLKYKLFRLKVAAENVRKVKILPQSCADLVKPDPGLTRERPDPLVYRCKKCRRIVASQKNIIGHIPHPVRMERRQKRLQKRESKSDDQQEQKQHEKWDLTCIQNPQFLIEKLKSLTCSKTNEGMDEIATVSTAEEEGENGPKTRELTRTNTENSDPTNEDVVEDAEVEEICRQTYFVEPLAWMKDIHKNVQGKLMCPKCANKLGSFSWIMGCQCPCGAKVAPAFYLVPSKVEWSNVVQNVQVTV